MADSKITALTALTAADPVNDMFPVVDVSDTTMAASGTTKRISVNNLLSCSPTASGALTITGDLTVDTNTLNVDSAGNAVGIGSTSPTANTLTLGASRFILCSDSQSKFGDSGIINGGAADANTQIQYFGGKALIFSEGASNTKMTLNATGLGVGLTPAAGDGSGAFKAAGTGSLTASTRVGLDVRELVSGNSAGIIIGAMTTENTGVIGSRTASGNIAFQTYNGAAWGERMRIDYLGNLILTSPSTPPTLAANGQLTVNATSNTNLRFSFRGSDGTTRVANITLA